MIIWKMIGGVAWGLVMHQANKLFESVDLPVDVERVSRYAVGMGGAFPVFWLMVRPMPRCWRWLAIAGYWTTAVSIGAGVVIGYAIDIFRD